MKELRGLFSGSRLFSRLFYSLWSSGDIRVISQGFLCGCRSCGGYLGYCLLLGTSRTAFIVFHSRSSSRVSLTGLCLVGLPSSGVVIIHISLRVGEGGHLTQLVVERCWPCVESGHPTKRIVRAADTKGDVYCCYPREGTDRQGRARPGRSCWKTCCERHNAVCDVPSSKQYPKYPPQDPHPRRKPWDIARMSPDDHTVSS